MSTVQPARRLRHVLFMPHHYREPGGKGGLRSWHLVNQLEVLGNVTVIVPGVDTLTGERARSLARFSLWSTEVRSDRVRLIRVNAFSNDRTHKFRRALFYLSFSILQFVRALFLNRFDVVMTTSMPISTMVLGWLLARVRRAALVIDVRDLTTDMALEIGYLRRGWLTRLMRGLEYFVYRQADRVITVSDGMAAVLRGEGVDSSRVSTAPIGFDALENTADSAEAARILAQLPDEAFVVLYSGTMGHVMDIPAVLQAARVTRDRQDILYLFVGDGQRLDEYVQTSRAERLNCIFTGRVPKRAIPLICARADVCVFPLTGGRIASTLLGNKIFDYMGAGKATLFTGPKGDVRQLIEASNGGLCFPPGAGRQLAEAVVDLEQDRERGRRMGEAARRHVMAGLTAPQTTARVAGLVYGLLA